MKAQNNNQLPKSAKDDSNLPKENGYTISLRL